MFRQLILTAALVATSACAPAKEAERSSSRNIGMANPASVSCQREGGESQIRHDAKGDAYGVCVFEDGRQCEEWTLFRDKRCVTPQAG